MILKNLILACAALLTAAFGMTAAAQSTDANFPTNVTTSEIVGTVRARDVGDSRLTSYYYTFDGGQGDMFINVVTRNFAGDIDVFAAEGLRPLTKMVIFAEGGPSETGRLIYMRKPERLILRVQGRPPDDDPATFQIKFGGSFIAMAAKSDDKTPKYDPAAPVSQQFGNPVHCAKPSRDGLVYVCDRTNNRIQVFKKDGTFVTEWFYDKSTLGAGAVWDLNFWPDANQTWMLNNDGENNLVRILRRSDGQVVGGFGRSGRNAGHFHWVHSIAVDSKGNIYTGEVDNGKRVQKFKPNAAP